MKRIFITAVDTDAGKTIVTAGLACYLQEAGKKVDVQKWVSTGDKGPVSDDLLFIRQVLDCPDKGLFPFQQGKNTDESEQKITRYHNPYSFSFPASPHFSAAKAGIEINTRLICQAESYFKGKAEYLLIEGCGGLMVPLTRNTLLIDLIKKMNVPVLLVVKNTLGCINKTLLSLAMIEKYKLRNIGLLFNDFFPEKQEIREDNKKIITSFSSVKILGSVPKLKSRQDLLRNFRKIGPKVLKVL